jgi:hypothetical protein
MKLADISHGSDWIIWFAFVAFIIISVVLISGHGSGLISGYNMASKEEKGKYDEKKLCRTMGIGMAVIAILILVTGLFQAFLPADSVYVILAIVVVDVITILIVANTVCKK